MRGLVVFSTRAGSIQPIERLPGGIAAGPSIEAITATSAVVTMKTAVDVRARIYQSGDLTFKTLAGASNRPAGRNVAGLSAGARVVGVSSNYGGQGIAGTYGGNQAIDGDPATEWSSNGDGDAHDGLDRGSSGIRCGGGRQIRLGPFTLRDAAGMHYFPVDVMTKRLRFNVRKSNGGNTGALEVEALAAP
ncbi:MAG: hypothetical protein ACRDGM_07675 [bacterium]